MSNPGLRRIAIYGASGSGKSTFARALAGRLGLPVVELDAIYHSRPNWQDLSTEEFRDAVREVLLQHGDGWVIEGNYSMVRDLILPSAELAVWLRLPFRIVYPRLVRRTLRRMRTGELLWGVNHESFRLGFFSRDSILLWGITNWREHHRKTRRALREAKADGVAIAVLRTPREVDAFLAALPAAVEKAPAGA